MICTFYFLILKYHLNIGVVLYILHQHEMIHGVAIKGDNVIPDSLAKEIFHLGEN